MQQTEMVIKWVPHSGPQTEFHLQTDRDVYECLFGGAKGPGKTDSILREGIRQVHIPKYRAIIFRRTYPQLGEIIDRSFQYFRGMGAKYSDKDIQIKIPAWTFPSGAKYAFGHCQHEKDKWDYQGKEFQYMGFDQLEQFTESQYLFLIAQNRTSDPKIKCYIRATANPGGVGHCVPFGEVLTKSGWREIQSIKHGEFIATLDKHERIVYRPVDQVHKSRFDGDILSFKSSTASITATHEHRIARRTETKTSSGRVWHGISLKPMSDLSKVTRFIRSGGWKGKKIHRFYVPRVNTRKLKLNQPSSIAGDQYCRLMGWFLSEGWTIEREKVFGICQIKIKNREVIRELLTECGFKFNTTSNGFTIYSPSWWSYLRLYGKCRDKFVPDKIKQATKEQIKLFIESAMLGDGYGIHYYTTSKKLADDIQELGLKIGFSPRITSRQRSNRLGLSYDVSLRDGRDGWLEKTKIKKEHFSGEVYCLGIEGLHRFFIRQEGTIWLSGNSWVKRRFIDSLTAGQKKFFKRVDDEDIECQENDPASISRSFIPSSVYDNPSIIQNDPNYVKRLEQLPETDKQALLHGNWEVFSGQFFKMWRKMHHVVEKPVNPFFSKFLSMDYGYQAPSSVGWWEIDFDGNLHRYRELVKEGLTYEALAKLVMEKTPPGEKINYCVADPAIWGDRTHHKESFDGESGAETMQRVWQNFTSLIKADNDRVVGWGRMRIMLTPDDKGHVKVTCDPSCRYSIRTIPTLIHDTTKKVEDLDTDGEDHAADDWRYGLMSRPFGVKEIPKQTAPINTAEAILSKVMAKKEQKPVHRYQRINGMVL